MKDIVYKNKEEAREACKKASGAVWEALNKHGAWKSSDDDCVSTYIAVHYLDENGKQKRYSFSD